MGASKDICSTWSKSFYGKHTFVKCCGACAFWHHLSHLQINKREYAYYISTFKYSSCVETFCIQRCDNVQVKACSSSISDPTCVSKMVSCLTHFIDSIKCEASCMQFILFILTGSMRWFVHICMYTANKLGEDSWKVTIQPQRSK
jgi:hypothetical protein